METREEDYVTNIFFATTKTTLLVFTDKGKLYWVRVYKLPLGNRTSKGKAIANVIQLAQGEKVAAILPIQEYADDKYIIMLTKKGVIKKTELQAFSNERSAGLIALTTDLDDCVIDAKISDGQSDVFIATREGMSIRFDESDVRSMGRVARGVRAMTLGAQDEIVSMEVISRDTKDSILIVMEKGYGKRSDVEEYRRQGRGGVGIITAKTTDKVGNVVGTKMVNDRHELILSTDQGQVIRMKMSEVRVIGRNTQGVRLINLDDREEKVTGLALINDDENTETPADPHLVAH
jgi:DNA gyrase subunit A